jgi:L-methionine (R)-S-oxide reductase
VLEVQEILVGSWLTDLSNFSSYFFENVQNLNWIGFYFSNGKKLILGPFQGRIACTEIDFNRGVCGAAFRKNEIMNVADVHQFPDHIACDVNSRSELVIPIVIDSVCIGVLDIDSPVTDRFTQAEVALFTEAVEILLRKNPQLKNISKVIDALT